MITTVKALSLLALSTGVVLGSTGVEDHSHGRRWSGTRTTSLQNCSSTMNGQLPSHTPSSFNFSGNVRKYYIAAQEVEWDYAPTGWDNWLGVPLDDSPRASHVTQYNTTFLKALYRGYTDSSFSNMTDQPPWQGTQGPTIRAEVGDLIEILFLNNLTSNYASMHSMGLAYDKRSEGGDYPIVGEPGQNQTVPLGDAVPPIGKGQAPGECFVYRWMVGNEAGPNDGEPARAHSYHSYVDLEVDTNSGLIGPTIIYASGEMNNTMNEYQEFPLLYMIYNENRSFLSGYNARQLSSNHSADPSGQFGNIMASSIPDGNYSVWYPQIVNLNDSGRFSGAPSFHTMNGYIFSNNPPYTVCENAKAIWYTYAYGSASHVFHMHGNGIKEDGTKKFAVSLNDGVSHTLYMNATDVGSWQVICHINNHQQKGMVSNYLVAANGTCGC